MLTDEEVDKIRSECSHKNGHINYRKFAREIQRAVLAKSIAQQERLHKEWSELWNPIDDAVRPLTPLGESVAAKALELISMAKAMPIPNQEPVSEGKYKAHDWWRVEVTLYDGTLLAIEPEMLAGKSDLTGRDEETIRAAGRHLLSFIGDPQPAQAPAITESMPIETMPFNTPVLVSDEKIIASIFFYKRKDRGYENSLYPQFIGAGDAEVRVSLYPNGCYSKLKWWRPMLEIPLSASPKPE